MNRSMFLQGKSGFPGLRRMVAKSLPLAMAGLLSACGTARVVTNTPQIGSKTLNVGHAALSAGHTEMASNVADAVLRHHPNDEGAWVLKSMAQYEAGDVGSAAISADHAVALKPNDPGAEMALGRALDKTDPKRALAAFKRAHDAKPEALGPGLDLGIAYIQNGQTDKGVSALESVATANPDDPTVTMDLALALVVRNHHGDAMRAAKMLRPMAHAEGATQQVMAAYRFASKRAGEPAR